MDEIYSEPITKQVKLTVDGKEKEFTTEVDLTPEQLVHEKFLLALSRLPKTRQTPKVEHGTFTWVPKGSEPHRSVADWAEMPGKNRREKRKNHKELNK